MFATARRSTTPALPATAGHDAQLPIDVTLSGAQILPARPDSAKAIDLENCITLRCERLAGVPALKMLSEYTEHALTFERLAAQEQDPKLKAELESQAKAYRKLPRIGQPSLVSRFQARRPTQRPEVISIADWSARPLRWKIRVG